MGFWDKLFGRPDDTPHAETADHDNASDAPVGGDPSTLQDRPRSADDAAADVPEASGPVDTDHPYPDVGAAEPVDHAPSAAEPEPEEGVFDASQAPEPEADSLSERIRRTPARPMPGFSSPEQVARSASAPRLAAPVNEVRTDGRFEVRDAADDVADVNPADYRFTTVSSSAPAPAGEAGTAGSSRVSSAPDTPHEPGAETAPGQPPLRQDDLLPPAPDTPDEDDERALDNAVQVLATAGILPKREVGIDDVATGCAAGVSGFRARPLTSTMKLVDADGEFLFHHVTLDRAEASLTAPAQLESYALDLAEQAGTAKVVRVRAVPDPGSRLKGCVNVINGHEVTDVAYDLDPDFGDLAAEEALTVAVATPERIAHPIVTDAEGERLTAWVDEDTPEAFFRALANENPQTCS